MLTPWDTVQNNNNQWLFSYKSEPINKDCNNLVRNPDIEWKKNGIGMCKDFICVSFKLINPTTGIIRWLETWKIYKHLKYLKQHIMFFN